VWLEGVLDRQEYPTCSAVKLLRIRSERVLLARHWPMSGWRWQNTAAVEQAVCQLCPGWDSWPCMEWKVIAAGWAHLPGYDLAWSPGPATGTYLHLVDNMENG
jgi:hypothetical protein